MGSCNMCTRFDHTETSEWPAAEPISNYTSEKSHEDEQIQKVKARKVNSGELAAISEAFDKEICQYGKYINTEEMESRISPAAKQLRESLPKPKINIELGKTPEPTFSKNPILFDKENVVYFGDWSLSCRKHGNGVLIKSDGGIYEGSFCDDEMDGYGRFISFQGDYYEGYLVI